MFLSASSTLSRSRGPTLYHDWWRAPSLLFLLIRPASQPVTYALGSALWPLLDFKPPIGVLPDSPSSFSCVILPRASLSLLLWGKKKQCWWQTYKATLVRMSYCIVSLCVLVSWLTHSRAWRSSGPVGSTIRTRDVSVAEASMTQVYLVASHVSSKLPTVAQFITRFCFCPRHTSPGRF